MKKHNSTAGLSVVLEDQLTKLKDLCEDLEISSRRDFGSDVIEMTNGISKRINTLVEEVHHFKQKIS